MDESSVAHKRLSDHELLCEVTRLASSERQATSQLVSALTELDARRLYLSQGCSSMFTYCTQVLHLAEHAAYNRIEVARAARRFPIILTFLTNGDLHLSAVRILAPHLTEGNHLDVLREATHKSKREVEQIVARLQPRPDVQSSVRKLPAAHPLAQTSMMRRPGLHDSPPATVTVAAVPSVPTRTKIESLAPERYKLQFTLNRETYDKLRRVQDLLRHRLPSGDTAAIFDRALTLLLTDLEKKKLAITERPRDGRSTGTGTSHVPAAVRRAVWRRDGGRCRFEGPSGRCRETGLLEFHHVLPYADGGATTAENLELRCAAHNRYEAERWFGSLVREVPPPYSGNTPLSCDVGSSSHFENHRFVTKQHGTTVDSGRSCGPRRELTRKFDAWNRHLSCALDSTWPAGVNDHQTTRPCHGETVWTAPYLCSAVTDCSGRPAGRGGVCMRREPTMRSCRASRRGFCWHDGESKLGAA